MKKLITLLCIACTSILAGCQKDKGMEKINNGPIEIGVYDKFDLDTWMTPFHEGRVVHNETVCLVGKNDKARLLYKPQEIISVRNYTLDKEYVKDVDYKIDENGYISLTDNTSINFIDEDTYYSGDMLKTAKDGHLSDLYYGEDFYKYQITVTYSHNQYYDGYIQSSYKSRFSKLIQKLENSEDVTFIFYGDSITNGSNSSEFLGTSPNTPVWTSLFTQYIAKQYEYTINYVKPNLTGTYTPKQTQLKFGEKGTITYINTAVGGWTTKNGLDNFNTYIKPFIQLHGCDLFVSAFGMNDGYETKETIADLTGQIVDKVISSNNEASIVLVGTMIPNPIVRNTTWAWNGTQPTFEEGLKGLAKTLTRNNHPCGVCEMTSVSKSILTKKRFCDITGNNVNHPSDFFVRIYAQSLFETIFK